MANSLKEKMSFESIALRAKRNWDKKTTSEKSRKSEKYKHVSEEHGYFGLEWDNDFDSLNDYQKMMLIKGEIIRTYDSLSSKEKNLLKELLGLV